jgi:hypothetical protein
MIAYPFCQRVFLGIANIHSVRSDFYKVRAAVLRTPPPSSLDPFSKKPTAQTRAPAEKAFPNPSSTNQADSSGWLSHIHVIFEGVRFIVERLEAGISVVVHCSDGWDRTPILTALVQASLSSR